MGMVTATPISFFAIRSELCTACAAREGEWRGGQSARTAVEEAGGTVAIDQHGGSRIASSAVYDQLVPFNCERHRACSRRIPSLRTAHLVSGQRVCPHRVQ
jgi:hypothetical protein